MKIVKISQDFLKDVPDFYGKLNSSTSDRKSTKKNLIVRNTVKNMNHIPGFHFQEDSPAKKLTRNFSSVSISVDDFNLRAETILKRPVFEPYFISNTTILQYENQDSSKKLSIMDIVETFFLTKKVATKLYFKILPCQSNSYENSY